MKQLLLLIAFILTLSQLSVSQTLNGKITDKTGQPVQYATVYIEELKQGTTSNTKGDYEIRVASGKYTVVYQSLGYEPVYERVAISDTVITRNIILPEQIYEIPEVRISPSGEDPAYIIMRKAIGLAPYYLNNINYYKANVYLKGNLLVKKIPRLIQRSMRMSRSDDNVSVSAGGKPQDNSEILKEGDAFLMESFNEIEYTAPDKYVQKVISYNSTFPEQGNEISPMEFIKASFYQPVLADMAISPLAPQAFGYYNYKYLGATLQGNYTINKIEVIPKRKSQQLFEGTIYIIEDLWCLHSVDLINENLAGKIRVRELYIPVQEETWMPVSHQFDINLEFLGIRADIGYSSSVKYLDVKPNTNLQKPQELATGFPERYNVKDTVPTKTEREIEKILQKDEMTNRDMIKLAGLMKKESAVSRGDSVSKNLEIKDNTVQIIEKGAGKRDSAYWAEIRPIPLSDIELQSLYKRKVDTASADIREPGADTTIHPKVKKMSPFRRTFKDIIRGHTWSDTTGFSFTYGGLVDLKNLSFNTVDGFVYGFNFRFNKKLKNSRSLALYPDVRYAFSREKIMWRANANYSMGGMKPKQIFIRTGVTSRDIGTGGGINPLINSISSLLVKKNYMKLYEHWFFTLGYNTEIVNGLRIELAGGFEDRRVLENHTNFSIFKSSREYTVNIPANEYLDPGSNTLELFRDQKHFEFVTDITYTPFQKYKIYNGNKVPQGSDWPVFRLTWKHGANKIPSVSDQYRHFNMFRFEVSRTHETGPFAELRWQVRTGGFADNRNLSFFDFFHFNSQTVTLLIDDYHDAFFLPAYYSLSSSEFFGELHLEYTTPYFLLKLLPGLSKTLLRENISLSYLGRRFHSNYTELGYSLSEIFLLGKAGIYVGFDDLKFRSAGVRFTLRLN
jgi:hypothetical protein